MNELLRLVIINFFLGGFAIAFFTVIAELLNYGLVGNLVGSLPIMVTYMIFYSYMRLSKEESLVKTTTLAWQGAISAVIYIIFNIVFALLYPRIKNIWGSYFIGIAVWILCQILLVLCILPRFDVKLFEKAK